MKEVKLITNQAGELTGIQVEINNDPEMAQEVFHLIGALQRAKETTAPTRSTKREPMSIHAFNKLIRQAKDSGELTQAEFFQLHPAWQRNAKSFSRA